MLSGNKLRGKECNSAKIHQTINSYRRMNVDITYDILLVLQTGLDLALETKTKTKKECFKTKVVRHRPGGSRLRPRPEGSTPRPRQRKSASRPPRQPGQQGHGLAAKSLITNLIIQLLIIII